VGSSRCGAEGATSWQGGDLRRLAADRDYLDLGTCINRYGPPSGVAEVLRDVDLRRLRAHPYDAERTLLDAYAGYLGIAADELIAGRGITEFIRLLADVLPTGGVAVVTPDYTDTIRSFPLHLDGAPGIIDTSEIRLERLDRAMSTYHYVLCSNPNNPLGIYIAADDLADVCRAHPGSTLVVDEAYVDFTPDGPKRSMIHSELPNVVVLLSPNKLFGIAGTRTGALWTRDTALRDALNARRLNWSISYLDALVASTALGSIGWVERTRSALLSTATEMESLLAEQHAGVVGGVPVHYRFVATDDALGLHRQFVDAGIAVRVFSGAEPGRLAGLRITAPTDAEFPRLARAIVG
jgi:histidinol-phosphate/aromatic aminotransferase/cobyric acid decarboxylase-like protein